MVFRDIILAPFIAVLAAGLIVLERKLTEGIAAYTDTTTRSLSVYKTLTEVYSNNTAFILKQNEIERSLQHEIEDLKSKIKMLEKKIDNAEPAVTFIRWGREDCSGNATDLVYSGYAGGSNYTHKGAAADFVCLPPDPSWGPHANHPSIYFGLMYGAEYEDEVTYGVPDKSKEVPCAMCRISAYSTQIMIPARTACYPGWVEAYHGYLAAGHFDHASATQYVCVDEHPQTLAGDYSGVDANGKLFYPVKTRCGSLKCPPYINDKVLACVVCVK